MACQHWQEDGEFITELVECIDNNSVEKSQARRVALAPLLEKAPPEEDGNPILSLADISGERHRTATTAIIRMTSLQIGVAEMLMSWVSPDHRASKLCAVEVPPLFARAMQQCAQCRLLEAHMPDVVAFLSQLPEGTSQVDVDICEKLLPYCSAFDGVLRRSDAVLSAVRDALLLRARRYLEEPRRALRASYPQDWRVHTDPQTWDEAWIKGEIFDKAASLRLIKDTKAKLDTARVEVKCAMQVALASLEEGLMRECINESDAAGLFVVVCSSLNLLLNKTKRKNSTPEVVAELARENIGCIQQKGFWEPTEKFRHRDHAGNLMPAGLKQALEAARKQQGS